MKTISLLQTLTIPLAVAFYTAFSPSTLYADQTGAKSDNSNIKKEESIKKQQRWAAFPIIASSPETGFMLGGMLFHFLPVKNHGQQASTIDIRTFATTEEQYHISLSPNVFFKDNRYRFNSSIIYSSWTANYYGLGNNSSDDNEKYEANSLGATATIEMKVFDSLILGLLGSYTSEDITTETGGMLQTENVVGATDVDYGGLGIRVGYDTRDNTNAPHTGALAVYESTWFDGNFSSDHNFNIQSLDIRYFTEISKDNILAFSTQMKDSHGQVPFRVLSSPDGTMLLRGIENGRYRDKILLGFQSEYRFPVSKKFTGTAFAEAAQVASEYSDIEISSFKTSLGAGIRYALNPKQRFNIRADIAWVDDGVGVIINVKEAF